MIFIISQNIFQTGLFTIPRLIRFSQNNNYHILIKLQMNKQIPTTTNLQPQISNQNNASNAIANPRKAATKVKEVNYHLDLMKRRLKVLQGQQDYNRYKTLDHQKRINTHNEIHDRLMKQRQILRKSLQKVNDISEVKQKTELIRLQIRQKIKQARKNLLQEKTDRTNSIQQESAQHENHIKESRYKELQQNKQRKLSILFQEQLKRQSVSRHTDERIKSIRLNKSIDSSSLTRKAQQSEQQISKLMVYEQQLLKKNSQSLQASQMMKHKFNQIFTTVSTHNSSRFLPEIRAKTNNSKNSGSTQTPII